MALRSPLRGWPVWQLPRWLAVCVTAVIAAYARMETLLGARGLPQRPAEAPFEYLPRVLAELRASSGSAFELTALFERAKFSHHAIDTELKEEAIVALETVRDELREAADRIQGNKDHRGRRSALLLAGIALGILFNPATGPQTRKWLSDKLFGANDEFTYQGSGNSS